MQKIYTLLIVLFIVSAVIAQSPQKLSYQAVVRDGDDNLVTNSTIGIRIQILQNSEFGAAIYVETHSPETNSNGLIQLYIGKGAVVNGDFAGIDWSDGPYFLETEIDPDGADNYSITTTAELLSVPYALHASYATKSAEVEHTPSAFRVIGDTNQNLPADESTIIDFTYGNDGGVVRL